MIIILAVWAMFGLCGYSAFRFAESDLSDLSDPWWYFPVCVLFGPISLGGALGMLFRELNGPYEMGWHPTDRFTPAESPASQIQLGRQTMGQLSARISELEQNLAAVERGHNRLRAENERLRGVLERIERWDIPPVKEWPSGKPMSYGSCYGSSGERDYIRSIARAALEGKGGVTK